MVLLLVIPSPALPFVRGGKGGVENQPIPQRIISLKPNITEILFAIGAGDQVVGVTTWCNRPEAAKKLPKVADYIHPNVEKIIALKPDLVVSSKENSMEAPIRMLQKTGIHVLLLSFKNIEDLFYSTTELADATGHTEEGQGLVQKLRSEIMQKSSVLGERGVKTLIVVGQRPLMGVGRKSFLNELLEAAGGENILEAKTPYPPIAIETVLVKNPEVIIDLSMGSEAYRPPSNPPQSPLKLRGELKGGYWEKYKTIDAVKKGRVYNLNISEFRLGPSLPEQIDKLKKLLSSDT